MQRGERGAGKEEEARQSQEGDRETRRVTDRCLGQGRLRLCGSVGKTGEELRYLPHVKLQTDSKNGTKARA